MAGERIVIRDYVLDTLEFDYEYKNRILGLSNMDGRLQEARIQGKGEISFDTSQEKSDQEFFWSVSGMPLAMVADMISYHPTFPYQGRISGKGHYIMHDKEISLKGSLQGVQMSLFGQPAMNIETDFVWEKKKARFQKIMISRDEKTIQGECMYEKGKKLTLTCNASEWAILPIHLGNGRKIPLRAILNADLSGNLDHMTGSFETSHISFSGKGDGRMSGHILLKKNLLSARIKYPWGEAKGDLDLTGDMPFHMTSVWKSYSLLDPNSGIIYPNQDYVVILTGQMGLRGLLKKGLHSLEGKFEGEQLIISGPPGKFESTSGYELILKDGRIATSSIAMKGENGSMELKGVWDLPQAFDFHIVGLVPLNILQKRIPNIKGITGKTEMNLTLKGMISDPLLQGEINLTEGGFSLPQYNFRADHIQGMIWLTRKSAYIKELTAHTRGGGWMELNGVVVFQGLKIHSFDLITDFDNLYVYKRDAYKGFLEGQIEWIGRPDFSIMTGDVLVKEARHSAYKDILQVLFEKKRDIETVPLSDEDIQKEWDKWLHNTNINVELDLGNDFWVRSPFYHATLTGDLLLKGSLKAPWLDGDIDVKEGEVIVGSQKFNIVSGKIKLENPELSVPTINAVALNDLNSYRLRLSISGPLNKPNLQFSATPYLSQPEILNMVFFGLTTEESERGQIKGDILSLMLSTTGQVLTDVLGDDVSYSSGFDTFKLHTFPQDLFRLDILNVELAEEGGAVEKLTLGKTLSKRLKIQYSRLKGEEQREIAEAEYTVADHLTLIGAQDNQGTYSLDLNIGFSF